MFKQGKVISKAHRALITIFHQNEKQPQPKAEFVNMDYL
jgi:hypothetical protein